MNLNLLYTLAIGNSKSIRYIFAMQCIMFIISIEMANLFQGIFISLILSVLVSTIFISILIYYNSDIATCDDASRYIKSIEDKNRIFRRLLVESYLVSLSLIVVFFLLDIIVASYAIYTSLTNFLLVLLFLVNHEKKLYNRFIELKGYKWIFDYNSQPIITTNKIGEKIEISMFDDNNKFVIGKEGESIDIKNLFDLIPPGTRILNNELIRPKFNIINFNSDFKYININTPCTLYLKSENKNDEKIKALYIDVLSRYKDLYHIKFSEIDGLKTFIKFNNHEIETYIEKNDYIKKFVLASEIKIIKVSIGLKEELLDLSLKKVINRIGQKVKEYEFEKNDKGIFISEVIGNNPVKIDISYFEKYMSLNEEEYKYAPINKFKNLIMDSESMGEYAYEDKSRDDEDNKKVSLDEVTKTLYRINIKGELIYVFIEDLSTLSELDELIVSKFINTEIKEVMAIASKDRN